MQHQIFSGWKGSLGIQFLTAFHSANVTNERLRWISSDFFFIRTMCGAASVNSLSLVILFTLHREFSIKSGTDCRCMSAGGARSEWKKKHKVIYPDLTCTILFWFWQNQNKIVQVRSWRFHWSRRAKDVRADAFMLLFSFRMRASCGAYT